MLDLNKSSVLIQFCGDFDWGKVSSRCSAHGSERRWRWSWAASWVETWPLGHEAG
jgi:hypothetical protein